MTDREAQVHYYKQTILIFSTGIFLSLGAMTAAVVQMNDNNKGKAGILIGICFVVLVGCVIMFTTDLLNFRKLVKLKE